MDTKILSGIGPKTKERLLKLGITDNSQLLFHFPRKYFDFTQQVSISSLVLNQTATVNGTIQSFQNIYLRSGKNMQKIILADPTGKIAIYYFNQPYLQKILLPNVRFSFAGTVSTFANKLCFVNPERGDSNTGKIIPVYPQTNGLTSKMLRKIISTNFPNLISALNFSDLPPEVLNKYKFQTIAQNLKTIHFPENIKGLSQAQTELSVYEIVKLQVKSFLYKKQQQTQKLSHQLSYYPKIEQKLLKLLPYQLTPSQSHVWQEIKQDLFKTTPANLLVQGDVGTGKTVLALLSSYQAIANHTTAIIIVPTQILARQHFQTFSKYLPQKNLCLLLDKKNIPKNSQPHIIITTHAIFYQKETDFSNVSLIIFDEQHKFGVNQRSFLQTNLKTPHIITMTATPIPRSVQLTMLGHLKLTRLEKPPTGRTPVKTYLVPENKQSDCWQYLAKEICTHHTQAFVVCPFIDSSETLETVQAAKDLYTNLKSTLPNISIELLHGKLKPAPKEKIMQDFVDNKISILITTPIIEVGVDIPNATNMVIMSGQRFGLAQLHQLRGRVGRGDRPSSCFVFSSKTDNPRLITFAKTHDGMKLAEFDLKNRGGGQLFGLLQHGHEQEKANNLTNLELVNLGQEIFSFMQKIPNLKFEDYLDDKNTKPIALN